MSSTPESANAESHLIESKGPHSYWVHRFFADRQGAGRHFSRVVFFSRNKRDAERYVRDTEARQAPND